MTLKVNYIVLLFGSLGLASCCFCDDEKKEPEPKKPVLTFAVAGHVYGSPSTYTSSIYPSFLKKINQDNAVRNFDFLFLTGDLVKYPTKEIWDVVKAELDSIGLDWYISQGNHDSSQYFDENIQAKKYLSMKENSNLFLVLNPNFPGWTLDSSQIIFVENELKQVKPEDNIFVFTHQLWWIRNAPDEFGLESIKPNSFTDFEGTSSFWKDMFPAFDSLPNPIYFFAGDIGAQPIIPAYYEDHYENFHFYGSGMGGGLTDNYLIVSVYENGDVEIERIDF